MILTCLNAILIKLLGDVSQIMKLEVSCLFFHDQACGGHFGERTIAAQVLQCGLYWTHHHCKRCPRYQQLGYITKRDMMSNPTIVLEIFYVWVCIYGTIPDFF